MVTFAGRLVALNVSWAPVLSTSVAETLYVSGSLYWGESVRALLFPDATVSMSITGESFTGLMVIENVFVALVLAASHGAAEHPSGSPRSVTLYVNESGPL